MRNGKAKIGVVGRASYNALWLMEHVLTERRMAGPLARIRDQIRSGFSSRLRAHGRVSPVERRTDLGPSEFLARYFRRSRPVVMAGLAKHWPAVSRWSFDSLRKECGDERVCVTNDGDPDFIALAEALRRIERGESRFGRFGTLLHHRPALRDDLDLQQLRDYCPRLSFVTSMQFFVAGGTSVTPLHADGTCNFHVQIHGEKVWRIVEPRFNPVMRPIAMGAPYFKSTLAPFDVGAAPDAPAIDVLEAVLEPGDVLFNPSFFWHEIRYRTPSISVGLRWASPTSFARGSPMMTLLMLMAHNPSVFEALIGAKTGHVEGFYR